MQESLIKKAETYIRRLLEEQLDDKYTYHDFKYTQNIKKSAIVIGQKVGLQDEELTSVALAALFHRTGNIKTYWDYAKVSIEIAKDFLEKENYPKGQLDKVLHCIGLLVNKSKPKNILEEVFLDALHSDLGQKGFPKKIKELQTEQAFFFNQKEAPAVWLKKQEEEIKAHSFHTKAAKKLFKKQTRDNRKKLKVKRKRQEEKLEKIERPLNGSSEARMMFKTALRNHIDLTNIADNKANIMLSINAIIITLAMPLLAGFIVEQPTLIYPLSVLLITCVVTVIYATMATRPIKMDGIPHHANLTSGETNLFFFGNFYKIPLSKYQESIRTVIKNDNALETSIINDLYYLGLALGTKFKLLRICYAVFMVGITLSVVTFGITLFFLPDLPVDLDELPQLLQDLKEQQEQIQKINNATLEEALPPILQEFRAKQAAGDTIQ